MLYTKCIGRLRGEKFDRVYAIVRRMPQPMKGIIQLEELSPSQALFFKQRKLVTEGQWNRSYFDIYFSQLFLHELSNEYAIRLLRQIATEAEKQDVALVCYCGDETMCHRSIVAGVLQGNGVPVRTESGLDFSKYATMLGKKL